jgi:hypothetical protein
VDTVDELVVSRENFLRRNPELPHRVEEIEPAWMTGEALGPCAPTTAKRPRS